MKEENNAVINEKKIRSLIEGFITAMNEAKLNGIEAMQVAANVFTNVAMVTQQPPEVLEEYIDGVKIKVKEHGKVLGDQQLSSDA